MSVANKKPHLIVVRSNARAPGMYVAPDYASSRANALVKKLRQYWLDAGADPHVYTTKTGSNGQSPRYDVRSDMINGLPRGYIWRGIGVVKK